MDWTVAAPYVTSLLALLGSGFAVWEARRARRETARIDLNQSVENELSQALRLFQPDEENRDLADALVARRKGAEAALAQWSHLLPSIVRDELRVESDLLRESQAYLAGERMGLTWKGPTEHLVPLDEFPVRVSSFADRAEKAFSVERDRASERLRTLY